MFFFVFRFWVFLSTSDSRPIYLSICAYICTYLQLYNSFIVTRRSLRLFTLILNKMYIIFFIIGPLSQRSLFILYIYLCVWIFVYMQKKITSTHAKRTHKATNTRDWENAACFFRCSAMKQQYKATTTEKVLLNINSITYFACYSQSPILLLSRWVWQQHWHRQWQPAELTFVLWSAALRSLPRSFTHSLSPSLAHALTLPTIGHSCCLHRVALFYTSICSFGWCLC